MQKDFEAYRLEDRNLKTNVKDSDASIELNKMLEQEEITDADFESISDYQTGWDV